MKNAGRVEPEKAIRGLYLLVFVYLGAFGTFLPIWLADVGWSDPQIGWTHGLRMGCLIVFPLVWGLLADRWGSAVGALRWMVVGAVICLTPLLMTNAFVPVIVALTAVAIFQVGILPILDAYTLSHAERSGCDYGRYRIWGSAGFVVGSTTLGILVSGMGRGVIPVVFVVTMASVAGLALMTRRDTIPRQGHTRPGLSSLLVAIRTRRLAGFYAISFFSRVGAHGAYLFLPLHLEALGVEDVWIPAYWVVGVVCEIVLMRNAAWLFGRFRVRSLLTACFGISVLQLGLFAWVDAPLWLLPVMSFHGFTFGIWYYASITWQGRLMPPELRASAQAFFQAISFGAGGMVSAVAAGYLFDAGSGSFLFGMSAVVMGVVALVTWWALRVHAGHRLVEASGV